MNTSPSSTRIAPTPDGYRLRLPKNWFDLELHPRLRNEAVRRLVTDRVRGQPLLWEQRIALTRLLTEQAGAAWDSGARHASAFCLPAGGMAITGALSVSVLPHPPIGSDAQAELLARLRVVGFRSPEAPWRQVDLLEVAGAGRCVRTAGVERIRTTDARTVTVVSMQLFVPLPDREILLVSASSPCTALSDDLLELFDAVLGTFELVDLSSDCARSDPEEGS